MKQIRGMWFPDDDTHFQTHLDREQLWQGRGQYQSNKLRAAVDQVHESSRGLAVDIGAHVGLWTHVLASFFEHVVAFEPSPVLFACWDRNCGLMENVMGHNLALSERDTDIRIEYVEGNSGNSFVDPGTGKGHLTRAYALDNFPLGRKIDLMKIDTEGWELFVVKGALQTILRDKPIIVLEQKPGNAERYQLSRLAALEYLMGYGAKIIWEKSGDYCVKFS